MVSRRLFVYAAVGLIALPRRVAAAELETGVLEWLFELAKNGFPSLQQIVDKLLELEHAIARAV